MSFLQEEELKAKFTVKNQAKVEILQGKTKDSKSLCLAIFKWIVTILIFLVILACLVISKLTIISLGQRLKPPTTSVQSNTTASPNGSDEDYEYHVAYTMIVAVIMIPHIVSFIRAFSRSAFSSNELWPGRLPLILGITTAIFETAGLCLLSLIVFSAVRNFMLSLFLMNGIFVVPLVYQMVSEFRKIRCNITTTGTDNIELHHVDEDPSLIPNEDGTKERPISNKNTLVLFTVAAVFSLAGLCILIFTVKSTVERATISISILLLSIAWTPRLLKFQTQPEDDQLVEHDPRVSAEPSVKSITIRTARHRMTLITSFVKIVLTLIFSFLVNYLTGARNQEFPLVVGFKHFLANKQLLKTFIAQVLSSLIGYLGAWMACKINLQKACFVFPFLLSTPVAVIIVSPFSIRYCEYVLGQCLDGGQFETWQIILIGVLLWLSNLSILLQFLKSQQFLMAKEELIFWLPTYDSILLEQQVLLNRKNEITDERFINYRQVVKDSHIYICTTMYHEADYEMEQLLCSIAKIDDAVSESGRKFEAHVFFDDGVRDDVIKKYALQLLSLLKSTVGVDPIKTTKMNTPYGMQLKYVLPHGMKFVVHLKDNVKVKNKKRWSQVMYMSYILDYKGKCDNVSDDLCYILATDADVQFSHKDVEALMDFMSRDIKIAAVCGRTHPMGSGPVVWYQIFDYAIGHWLQKVANHVLGTVLCSPGCFSVYRARAIRDVLPLYSSGVSSPMDFLTKDMGEDRWFCTLLVEAGWRLEYCAIAADSTYCPDEFNEFFKQRRRWGPSTFANQIVLMNKQESIRRNNDSINMAFMAYQMIQMLASVIGPSTVLLFMAAGLQFAFPGWFNMIALLLFLIIVTIAFALVCMYCESDTQLQVAKLLTFFFAMIMAVTTVGCLTQITADITKYVSSTSLGVLSTTSTSAINGNLTSSSAINGSLTTHRRGNEYIFEMTTWYIFVLIGVFILTGILHGKEAIKLVYGVLYWLCLPSGHLLLTIYSIANLTDRSWGTREGKSHSQGDQTSWRENVIKFFMYACWCCVPPQFRREESSFEGMPEDDNMDIEDALQCDHDKDIDTIKEADQSEDELIDEAEHVRTRIESDQDDSEQLLSLAAPKTAYANMDYSVRPPPIASASSVTGKLATTRRPFPPPRRQAPRAIDHLSNRLDVRPAKKFYTSQAGKRGTVRRSWYSRSLSHGGGTIARYARPSQYSAFTLREWLPKQYHMYIKIFEEHGFDNATFIAGVVKEKDLMDIGISNRGHRKKLVVLIDQLPPEEVVQEVPDDVEGWLIGLGLEEYWPNFVSNSYTEQRDLADLKYMSREQISTLFDIKKEGHLRKLLSSTIALQYPTKAQKLIRQTRLKMINETTKDMKICDVEEHEFWKRLREICLLPEQAAFNHSAELGDKLAEMRVYCFVMLLVVNVLWLTFIGTIISQGPNLHLMGGSFAGVAFTFVNAFLLILQFISLLIHRVTTLMHFIARAPFTPGNFKGNWAWSDSDMQDEPNLQALNNVRRMTFKQREATLRRYTISKGSNGNFNV